MRRPAEVVARWKEVWNAGDPDGLAALFVEDAEFVNVVGLWWHDREAIREAHAYGLRTIFPGSTISMRPPRVRLVGEDAAVVQARWRILGQVAPSGEPADPREGVFTFVLERSEQDWLVVAAQNTDRVQGAETHVRTAGGRAGVRYR